MTNALKQGFWNEALRLSEDSPAHTSADEAGAVGGQAGPGGPTPMNSEREAPLLEAANLPSLNLPSPNLPSLNLNSGQRGVTVDGKPVALTAKEYLLMEVLFTARGKLFGRGDLLERVWGLEFAGDDRIVDAYIKRLRSKLGAAAVETVRGLGYRCPLPETPGVAQPHLQRLPPEARLLTRLAQRILQVTEAAHIVASVRELMLEHYDVHGVSLWNVQTGQALAHAGSSSVTTRQPSLTPDLLDQAPCYLEAGDQRSGASGGAFTSTLHVRPAQTLPAQHRPIQNRPAQHRPALALVPLGTGTAGDRPWAVLAFWGGPARTSWPLEVRSALDAVAGLVNPALRLNQEIARREQAEQEIRTLNHELELRVRTRTRALARANAELSSLYDLSLQLAGAGGVQEVLESGLSALAQLASAPACSLWRLRTHELSCLAAYSPGRHDVQLIAQQDAPRLASLLRQAVNCTAQQSVMARSATLPGGRQVLMIPVASGLQEVHTLYLELPGEVPTDLRLIDAAARSFGLAYERQMQALILTQAALSDELTGLPNRRALLSDLTAELSFSQRHRTSLTLSLFEITDIRAVNRLSGYAAGNDLIRELAGDIRKALRQEDRVYRLGGALLASLVRSTLPQEGPALKARLDTLAVPFKRRAPGQGQLSLSHTDAPDEADMLADLLRLGIERLECGRPDTFQTSPVLGSVDGSGVDGSGVDGKGVDVNGVGLDGVDPDGTAGGATFS